jgi:hypothetical protein
MSTPAGSRPTVAGSARIETCADLPTLERWLEEAAVAGSAEEALRS